MNIADLPDDSESSDEDYVPEGITAELPSEEESDGDAEDDLLDSAEVGKRSTKRQQKGGKPKKKRKATLEDAAATEELPKKNKTDEEVKQSTDALWADFMKDTGFKTRAQRQQTSSGHSSSTENSSFTKPNSTKVDNKEPQGKVKVTQVYKFAGEEVRVEKEVCADSAEARLANTASGSETSAKKPAAGGRLTSILNQLGKKPKINTLEKSKLDWEQFKKEENIQDELQAYSKSKDGYLEKQDFLARADLRRFEVEKEIRNTLRSNRMNNINM